SVRHRLYDIQNIAHRNAAPFGDARPSLNTKMRGDLFLLGQGLQVGKGELARRLDQPINAQAVVHELTYQQRIVFGRVWHRPIGPKMRGDVLFGQLSVRVPPFGEPLDPADHELSDPLHQSGMTDGEWRGDPPGKPDEHHGHDEKREAYPGMALYPGEHVVGVLPQAGD